MKRGDYTKYSFIVAAWVVAAMLAISLIPPFTLFGVEFKRANILSDIYKFDESQAGEKEAVIAESDLQFIADMEAAQEQALSKGGEAGAITTMWSIGGEQQSEMPVDNIATEQGFEGVVKIEDFSDGNSPSISDFCALLGTATSSRVVRLGFLGDSYIEGDIITADIREILQSTYGGGGVGFVPFSTPLAQNRPTVIHTFGGWENYNLINKRTVPEELKELFFISGVLSTPKNQKKKAWTRYESTNFRGHLKGVSSARVIFKNRAKGEVEMVVNDSIERVFEIEASERVQQINISAGVINSVEIRATGGGPFVGYGVVMESRRGVSVDNYSIRSNSGLALFGTNSVVNREIDQILHYDMIVLQYGLNMMREDVASYSSYGEQLKRVINWIKTAFPNSTIIVLGVGDRSMQRDGEFVSMPSVKGMIKAQREAAKECGIAFWSIYDAMGGENSMSRYVEWGWAAKDHTHLGFGGGRQIAKQFVKAVEYVRAYPGERFQRDDNYYRVQYIDIAEPSDSIAEHSTELGIEQIKQQIEEGVEIGQQAHEQEQDSMAVEKVDSLNQSTYNEENRTHEGGETEDIYD